MCGQVLLSVVNCCLYKPAEEEPEGLAIASLGLTKWCQMRSEVVSIRKTQRADLEIT